MFKKAELTDDPSDWEEMEIVEGADTPGERSDTFWRLGPYGVAESGGAFQAYIVAGGRPFMVADGFETFADAVAHLKGEMRSKKLAVSETESFEKAEHSLAEAKYIANHVFHTLSPDQPLRNALLEFVKECEDTKSLEDAVHIARDIKSDLTSNVRATWILDEFYLPLIKGTPTYDKLNTSLENYKRSEVGGGSDVLPVMMVEMQNAIDHMIEGLDASRWLKKRAAHRVNRIKDYAFNLDAYDNALDAVKKCQGLQDREVNDKLLRWLEDDFIEQEKKAHYKRAFESKTPLSDDERGYMHEAWRKRLYDAIEHLNINRQMENDLEHLVNRIKFNTEDEYAENIDDLYSRLYDILYNDETFTFDRIRDAYKLLTKREDESGYSLVNPPSFKYKDWDEFLVDTFPSSPAEARSEMESRVRSMYGVPSELREDALALIYRTADGQEGRSEGTVLKELYNALRILRSKKLNGKATVSRLCVLLLDGEQRRGLEPRFEPTYDEGMYVGWPETGGGATRDDWEWYLVNRIALLDAPDLLRNDVRALVGRAKYSTEKMPAGDVEELYKSLGDMLDADERDELKLGRMYRTLVNTENIQKYPYSRNLTYDDYDWLMDQIRPENSRKGTKSKTEPPGSDENEAGGEESDESPAPLPISVDDIKLVKEEWEIEYGPGSFDKKKEKAIRANLEKAETDEDMRSKLVAMYDVFGGDSDENGKRNTVISMATLDKLPIESIVGCEKAVAGDEMKGRINLYNMASNKWRCDTNKEASKKWGGQLDTLLAITADAGRKELDRRRRREEAKRKISEDEKELTEAYEALKELLAPYERAKQNADPKNRPSERALKRFEDARNTLLSELRDSPDYKVVSDQAVAILKKELEPRLDASRSHFLDDNEIIRINNLKQAIENIKDGTASIETLEVMGGAVDEEDRLPLLKMLWNPDLRYDRGDKKGRRVFDYNFSDLSYKHDKRIKTEENLRKKRLEEEEKKRKNEEKRMKEEERKSTERQLDFDELYSKAYNFLFGVFDNLSLDEWNDPDNLNEYDRLQEKMKYGLANRLDKADALRDILSEDYDDEIELYDAILRLCDDEDDEIDDEEGDEADESEGSTDESDTDTKIENMANDAVNNNLRFAEKEFTEEDVALFKEILADQMRRREALYGKGSLKWRRLDNTAYDIVMRVNRNWRGSGWEPSITLRRIRNVPDTTEDSRILTEQRLAMRDADPDILRTRPWDRFNISSYWSRPFFYLGHAAKEALKKDPAAKVKLSRGGPKEIAGAQRVGSVPYVIWHSADEDGNYTYPAVEPGGNTAWKTINIYDPDLKPEDLQDAINSLINEKYDRGVINETGGTAGKSWNDFRWLVYYARHGLLTADLQPANQAEFEKMLIGEQPYMTKTGARLRKEYDRLAAKAMAENKKIESFEDWIYEPDVQKKYKVQASHVLRLPFTPFDLSDPREVPVWMSSYGNSYKFQGAGAGIGHLAEYQTNFGHVGNPRTGRSYVSPKEWAEHARFGYDLTDRERRGNFILSGGNQPIGVDLGLYGENLRDPQYRRMSRREREKHNQEFEEDFGIDLKYMPRMLEYGDVNDMEEYMKILDDCWAHDNALFMRWMAEMKDRRNNGRADLVEDPVTWSKKQSHWTDMDPVEENGRTFKNFMYRPSAVLDQYESLVRMNVQDDMRKRGAKLDLKTFNAEVNRRLVEKFGEGNAPYEGMRDGVYVPMADEWMKSEGFEEQYNDIVNLLEKKKLIGFEPTDTEGFRVFVPKKSRGINGDKYRMRWNSRKGDPKAENYDENYAKIYSNAYDFSRRMSSYADMLSKQKRGEGMRGAPSPQTVADELEKTRYRQENRRRLEAGARRGRRLAGTSRWNEKDVPGMENYFDAFSSRFGIDLKDLYLNGYVNQGNIFGLANTKVPWDERVRPIVLAALVADEDKALNYIDWVNGKESNDVMRAVLEAAPEERKQIMDGLLDLAKKNNPDMADEIDALTLRDENGDPSIGNAPVLSYLRNPETKVENRMRLVDYMKSSRKRRTEMMDAATGDEEMKNYFEGSSEINAPANLILAQAVRSGRIDKEGFENLMNLPEKDLYDALQKESALALASKGRGWNSTPYEEGYGADKSKYSRRNAERSAKFVNDIYSKLKDESDAHPERKIDLGKRFYEELEKNVAPVEFNGKTIFVEKPYDTFISQPLSERMKDVAVAYDPEDPGLFNRYSQAVDEYTGSDEYEPFATYMRERDLAVPDFTQSWEYTQGYDTLDRLKEKYKPPETITKSYGRRLATTKVWNIMNEMFKDKRQTVTDGPAYTEPVVKSVDDAWREAVASRGYKIDKHDTSARDDDSEDSFASIYKRANEKADSERGRPVTYTSEVEMNATWGRGPRPVKETYRHVDYDDRNSPMPADITVIHSGDGNMTPKKA